MNDRTALYRHFNVEGSLLYIGISISAVVRFHQHHKKSWYYDIANITIEWFDSRSEAEDAERKAIWDEKPAHNIRRTNPYEPEPPARAEQFGPPKYHRAVGYARTSDERQKLEDVGLDAVFYGERGMASIMKGARARDRIYTVQGPAIVATVFGAFDAA